MLQQTTYLQRAGATFLALINDLKRNEASAARDLGVSEDLIHEIVAGERPISREILDKAVKIWPVNERDFFPIHDDVSEGVVVMNKSQSVASSRVLQRAGRDYYEYRDTAMSRVAMIRPEWIKMLQIVHDNDPENPNVEWNNGHFLFQFTYFVGEVNYYYEWNGRKFCEPMNTGDSVFGLPFAKHSFGSRNPKSPALILALTYGGRLVGDAQHELGVLGDESACKYVLPMDDQIESHAALLRFHVANGSYSCDYLATAAGIKKARLKKALSGEVALAAHELQALADALRVPVRDLLVPHLDTNNGVVIVHHENAPSWVLPNEEQPNYRMRELAGSSVTPYSKSLEIEVLPHAGDSLPLETGTHQYGYNLGPASATLGWICDGTRYSKVIQPEESFFIKPHIAHWFESLEPTRLLLLRVGGKIVGDALLEASIVGKESLSRVVAETMCWYNEEGSHHDDHSAAQSVALAAAAGR
jgi:transcriptional regulator with XRE-family HTH domain